MTLKRQKSKYEKNTFIIIIIITYHVSIDLLVGLISKHIQQIITTYETITKEMLLLKLSQDIVHIILTFRLFFGLNCKTHKQTNRFSPKYERKLELSLVPF